MMGRPDHVPEDAGDLRGLRESVGISQADLAGRMGVGQAAVSKLERRSDLYVSSLRQVVEVMGGQLDVQVRSPDRAPIRLGRFDGAGTAGEGSGDCRSCRGYHAGSTPASHSSRAPHRRHPSRHISGGRSGRPQSLGGPEGSHPLPSDRSAGERFGHPRTTDPALARMVGPFRLSGGCGVDEAVPTDYDGPASISPSYEWVMPWPPEPSPSASWRPPSRPWG